MSISALSYDNWHDIFQYLGNHAFHGSPLMRINKLTSQAACFEKRMRYQSGRLSLLAYRCSTDIAAAQCLKHFQFARADLTHIKNLTSEVLIEIFKSNVGLTELLLPPIPFPIPKEIGQLTFLKKLFIDYVISKKGPILPVEICSLTSLEEVQMGANSSSTSLLSRLTNLKKLVLERGDCTGTEDIKAISQLTQLEELKLPQFDGSLLGISKLSFLKKISIVYEGEHTEELFKLPNLKKLKLAKYCLQSEYDKFFELRSLEELDLTANVISPKIGNLTTLKTLKLFEMDNSLIIPDTIVNLSELETLDLRSSTLTVFPESASKLEKLNTLILNLDQFLYFKSFGNAKEIQIRQENVTLVFKPPQAESSPKDRFIQALNQLFFLINQNYREWKGMDKINLFFSTVSETAYDLFLIEILNTINAILNQRDLPEYMKEQLSLLELWSLNGKRIIKLYQ